jgi:asparagine synthase (glutamine-hydrolysing)
MCGIFGLVQSRPFRVAELAGMSRLLRHRGPDDEGFAVISAGAVELFGGPSTPSVSAGQSVPYYPTRALPAEGTVGMGGVALGHRRLSILDLSPRGHQPMSYLGRYWIVYNGEVYNFVELRAELQAKNYRFLTTSDTEVILAAYDCWGQSMLSHLNGMWAIAIVDTIQRKLFLARDRYGIKPLYLRASPDSLAFASEIKAFSAVEGWRPRANRPRLLDMLVWNVSDHSSETMFEGVVQLPAGHFMELDLFEASDIPHEYANLYRHPTRWYSLPPIGEVSEGAAAANELRELLTDSVNIRLRADVPVGSCLSGGLDSSSIVCLLADLLRRRANASVPHVFTATSDTDEYDESRFARAVALCSGAEWHHVTPDPKRLFEEMDTLIWHQDEPFLSTSIFAQWCVFRLAREAGVPVMLDGQGADEILCGYRGYFGAQLAGMLRSGGVGRWLSEATAIGDTTGYSYFRLAGYTAAYLMPGLTRLFGRIDRRAYADNGWLKADVRRDLDVDPIRRAGGRASSVRSLSVAQISATNLPMLLHWEDRNSMAFSVEARVPFLDYRVVELCLNMADRDKLRDGVSKAVLRESMRGKVPDLVLDRRDKLGFVTAEAEWLRGRAVEGFRERLRSATEVLDRILSPRILKQFDEVVAGRRPFDYRYWRAICAARWVKAFELEL